LICASGGFTAVKLIVRHQEKEGKLLVAEIKKSSEKS
jgi:hypothetical protein